MRSNGKKPDAIIKSHNSNNNQKKRNPAQARMDWRVKIHTNGMWNNDGGM